MSVGMLPEVDLNFDLMTEVPCVREGCENVAAWVVTLICPVRHSGQICDKCKRRDERARSMILAQATMGLIDTITCGDCNPVSPLKMPYMEWRPL